jgi:hypothetical protein
MRHSLPASTENKIPPRTNSAKLSRVSNYEFQVLDKVTVPDGHMSTRKSLVVESGKLAIVEA